jgi:Arc/MetJ family transcription regulator
VSRMMSGGSAGFSTMTALPRAAPPTTSMACAVVSVNSSMLARVPGPTDRDAIDATISAYATGVTRPQEWTCQQVYCWCMGRTNIDLDDELVAIVMRRHGLRTKREAVDLALRRLAGPRLTPDFLTSLEGIGWDGDLEEMRSASGAP